MTLEQYFRAYPTDDLVNGAERCFANEILNFEARIPSASQQKAFFPTRKQDDSSAVIATRPDSSFCVTLTGNYRVGKKEGSPVKSCSLSLYAGTMMPAVAACSCDDFAKTRCCCPHIAGLLTAYLVSCEGEDALRGTVIEQQLRNRTGAEDPFQQDALKRTDDRLLSLFSHESEARLPVFTPLLEELVRIPISSECLLSTPRGNESLVLGLLIGPGRHYVVKDLRELFRAYREGTEYTFGKKPTQLSRESCDPFTQKLLDYLSGLSGSSRFIQEGSANPARYIRLSSAETDRLFELLDGEKNISLNGAPISVALSHRELKLVLRKKSFGATVGVNGGDLIQISAGWYYLKGKTCVYRVPRSTSGPGKLLSEMLSWKEPAYIRESDMTAVCRELAPYFEQCGEIVTKGLDLENYEREKPSFRFHLDLEENGMLICLPYALYPRQEKEYMLYDSNTDFSRRNPTEENRVADVIGPVFDAYEPGTFSLSAQMDDDRLFEFMKEKLPLFETLGVVMATDAILNKRIRNLPAVSVHVSVNQGKLLVSMQGARMSREEMIDILSSYNRKKKYHRLHSGSFVTFEEADTESLETMSELWQHYGADDPEQMQLPLFRALYLQEMLGNRAKATLDGSDAYRALVEKIGRNQDDHPVPDSLREVLRPYQAEGFRWIHMLKSCGFGGILADDMGLGKTLQVLAFLLSEKESGKTGDALRTLIICPASLVYNWQKEILTFTPALKSQVIAGQAALRRDLIGSLPDADVWITSYDLLKRDIALYESIHFANEIIDEAQFIKNQNAQASRSVRIVDSDFRLALTGTPIENHLGELWSILDYLMPGFLYGYSRFQKEFETPIVINHDEKLLTRLRGMVHPFILRRLKRQVLKELPEKIEEVVTVQLDDAQRQLYDASVEELRQLLGQTSKQDFRAGKLQFLARLTRLRQICCDPSLLYDNYPGGSAKLEACLQLIHEAVDGGHKLLLFSQFTSMLDILCARLTADGLAWHRLDGSTSKEARMQMVDSFANDDVPVFCISLKAGGTGLNLTAADIVIHYDPWWNQAAQDQATDRTHRIGQTQRVNVYELIAGGTIEEEIMKLKESKTQLADDILSGETIASTLIDRDDLLALLK